MGRTGRVDGARLAPQAVRLKEGTIAGSGLLDDRISAADAPQVPLPEFLVGYAQEPSQLADLQIVNPDISFFRPRAAPSALLALKGEPRHIPRRLNGRFCHEFAIIMCRGSASKES